MRFLGFFLLFFPLQTFAKYQVCSITINSDDEIETFKEFLPEEHFEFKELLPNLLNPEQDHSSHWFSTACKRQDLKCDILVISGHFGGTFFGESGWALPTEVLEEKACQESCPGILSNVKEIFLFGCNTLASKKQDSRSYQDYLTVLENDGMTPQAAQRVVAARYSPLEAPFHERMNFIFSGSHTIYGFEELSPLGKNIRSPLRRYLQAIDQKHGGYKSYLDEQKFKREKNDELFYELKQRYQTTINQEHISRQSENPEKQQLFENKCLLMDENANFTKRLKAFRDIVENDQVGEAFFVLDQFLEKNKKQMIQGAGRDLYASIKDNKTKRESISSYRHGEYLEALPYIKIVVLSFLQKFQWTHPVYVELEKQEALARLIKEPTAETYSSLLLLLANNQIKPGRFSFNETLYEANYIKNIWSLLIAEKLRSPIPFWEDDIFAYCKENEKELPGICHQAFNTLAHVGPSKYIAIKAFDYLKSPDEDMQLFATRMMGQSRLTTHPYHLGVAELLDHENSNVRQEALEALGYLRTPYPDIQKEIALLLPGVEKEENPHGIDMEDVLWTLKRLDITEEAQKILVDYAFLNQDDPHLFAKIWSVLKNTRVLSSKTLVLFYRYLDLERIKDENFVLIVVDTLSRRNLRDLGFHARLAKLQNHPSLDFKKEALRRMRHLKWMHSEVQGYFLGYLEEEELRPFAISILKNISNLEEKTLVKLKDLYESDKEGLYELAPLLKGRLNS